MLSPNHLTGGFAFTAVFCSFSDTNILESPERIAATLLFSVLPDIDHRSSLIGKMVYPLAKYLDTHFGHRTITHSIGALALVTAITYGIAFQSSNSETAFIYGQIAFFAYLSHLIFDMCTRAGIPFFLPFSAKRCVLPANPKMRLKSGDLRAEGLIFLGFIILNLMCFDLYQKGFWTSYNESFATFKHVQKERLRGKFVSIRAEKNTGEQLRAEVIEVTGKKAIILAENQENGNQEVEIQELQTDHWSILAMSEGKPFQLQEIRFQNVGLDSLESLLSAHKILSLELKCTQEFTYQQSGTFAEKATKLKLTRPKNLSVKLDFTKKEKAKASLQKLESKLQLERLKQEESHSDLHLIQRQIRKLKAQFENLSLYEQGKAIASLKQLRKEAESFEVYQPDTLDIHLQKIEVLEELEAEGRFEGKIEVLQN